MLPRSSQLCKYNLVREKFNCEDSCLRNGIEDVTQTHKHIHRQTQFLSDVYDFLAVYSLFLVFCLSSCLPSFYSFFIFFLSYFFF